MNNSYDVAASEIIYILDYLPKQTVSKIPTQFIEFLNKHSIPNYNPHFDFSKGLDNINLNSKTRALLGMIYRNYLCSSEEQKIYDEILFKNEEIYQNNIREKYNPDNIFKNNDINKNIEQHVALVEYKEQKWYEKLFKNILNIFKKKC